jgi:hypothetical protein
LRNQSGEARAGKMQAECEKPLILFNTARLRIRNDFILNGFVKPLNVRLNEQSRRGTKIELIKTARVKRANGYLVAKSFRGFERLF